MNRILINELINKYQKNYFFYNRPISDIVDEFDLKIEDRCGEFILSKIVMYNVLGEYEINRSDRYAWRKLYPHNEFYNEKLGGYWTFKTREDAQGVIDYIEGLICMKKLTF